MNRFVYVSIGLVCMLAILAISFRTCTSMSPQAVPEPGCGTISIEGRFTVEVGDTVQYRVKVENMKVESYEWLLGNSLKSNSPSPRHVFREKGSAWVKVTLNGLCKDSALVSVKEKVPEGSIEGPSSTVVGRKERFAFSGDVRDEEELKWQFSESGEVDATGERVRYAFNGPGNKKVQVLFEGKVLAERIVRVERATPPPAITESEFQRTLQQIANSSSGSEKNRLYESLKRKVRDENIPVIVNGQQLQFYDYFILISMNSGIRINRVKLTHSGNGISRVEISQSE
jgi:hypothetical protein